MRKKLLKLKRARPRVLEEVDGDVLLVMPGWKAAGSACGELRYGYCINAEYDPECPACRDDCCFQRVIQCKHGLKDVDHCVWEELS